MSQVRSSIPSPASIHAGSPSDPAGDLFRGGPFEPLARQVLAEERDAAVGGLWGSAAACLTAALVREGLSLPRPAGSASGSAPRVADSRDAEGEGARSGLLVVLPGAAAAEVFAADLDSFGVKALLLPTPDAFSGETPVASADRLRALGTLAGDAPPPVVVASASAVLAPVAEREALRARRLDWAADQRMTPQIAAAALVDRGYQRVPLVEAPGQFALRGSLVDVYPLGADLPSRIEFDDDRIESIRRFDPDDQSSREDVGRLMVWGAFGREARGSILDYLAPGARIAWRDPGDLDRRLARVEAAEGDGGRARLEAFRRRAASRPSLRLDTLPLPDGPGVLNARLRSVQRFSSVLSDLPRELRALAASAARLIVFCDNEAEGERLRELLREEGEIPPSLETRRGRLDAGFASVEPPWIFVSHAEIFHCHQVRRGPDGARIGAEAADVLALEPGDTVVHALHGIGRFLGMKRIVREGRAQEFMILEYADHARLQVPASQMDLVQKYFGGSDAPPALSALGTSQWSERRLRAQAAIDKLARDLLSVQALREQFTGMVFPPDTEWQRSFEASFPFTDTPDQRTATTDIKRDMESTYPMDRLVCGDVGYGKTELAMRAAFKAAVAGKQVAVLVPTTVLAEQHGVTFRERMAAYPIHVAVLSRFRSPRDQREILRRAASGEIDILIGTHRLLQGDVQFRDLGLVIIDEEQRFGVEHKERLKRLRATVDILTLTATPIPRTLHMALLGLRDISNLVTPPRDRLAIHTEVCVERPETIGDGIRREIERDGQVFFVHNRVYDIDTVATGIRALVPEARVGVVHGQLHEEAIEERMTAFLDRQIDVLVTTTIIESGVDIPNANTLFVHDADLYGLADLHQLRGRVGRYRHQAYAYFLLPDDRPVTPESRQRLKAIEEFSELGAGFKIALRDLEIRGVGNLLGREQHGHIAAIGYDLYCKMLDRTVRRIRKEPAPPPVETVAEFDVDAEIPAAYVPEEGLRLDLYRRCSRCRSAADLEALRRELRDRFGPPPPTFDRFLRLVAVRIAAESHRIESLTAGPDGVAVRYRDGEAMEALKRWRPKVVRIVDEKAGVFAVPADPRDPERQLNAVLNLLTARPS
jgi:transcription-repair coupling factor (superfamily II helicase)